MEVFTSLNYFSAKEDAALLDGELRDLAIQVVVALLP